jgi:S-formylglutathione hydrolase FrmB
MRPVRILVAIAAALAAAVAAGLLVLGAFARDTHGARVVHFTITSRFVHQDLPVTGVVPPGVRPGRRPLLVFLHGRGDDQDSNLDGAMFAALSRLGSRAPDVVFPYGGDASYWHNRQGGAWGSYVLDEVIEQAVKRLHADSRRVAIGGISMGGFGALNLARLHPRRFCAVGAHSAALWARGADTAAGAFDDAEDFARNNVIGAARAVDPYAGIAVWIDVGDQDPFRAADALLASELRHHGQRGGMVDA